MKQSIDIHKLILGNLQTNCYLVRDGSFCAIVDPADEAQKIRETLQMLGWQPTAILLTHAHFDHMLALDAFSDLPIYLHEADEEALSDPIRNVSFLAGMRFAYSGQVQPLHEGDRIGPFEVLHTPGHTPGSCCFYAPDILISGDTMFSGGGYGRTDFPGGNQYQLLQSLQRLSALPGETILCPGHGPEGTVGKEAMLWLRK